MRGVLAAAGLAVLGLALTPASAAGGSIKLPCTTQLVTVYASPADGICGKRINGLTPGAPFTLHPVNHPADLDIHFYQVASNGQMTYKGSAFPGYPTVCGDVKTGFAGVPAAPTVAPGATLSAIVVLSASECPGKTDVTFTFTQ